jgi:hypothetical protein
VDAGTLLLHRLSGSAGRADFRDDALTPSEVDRKLPANALLDMEEDPVAVLQSKWSGVGCSPCSDSAVSGTPIGSTVAACIAADGNGLSADWMCNVTAHLAGGDLTAVGPLTNAGTGGTIVVSGGTGSYANDTGTLNSNCNYAAVPTYCTYTFSLMEP